MKFSSLKKLNFFKGDPLDPKSRFLDLEGSRYFSGPVGKFFSSPHVYSTTVLMTLWSAVNAAITLPEQRQEEFVRQIIFTATGIVLCYVVDHIGPKIFGRKPLPVSKDAAIDKRGRLGTASDTLEMKNYYIEKTITGLIATIIAGAVIGNSVGPKEALAIATFFTAKNLWYFYAAWRLSKSKWSITTKPPQPEKREAFSSLLTPARPVTVTHSSEREKTGLQETLDA